MIWEKDEPGEVEYVTFAELDNLVSRFARVLKDRGVERGDRVAIYYPVSPLGVASMLACAKIGAVHSVVFAGFSAEALRKTGLHFLTFFQTYIVSKLQGCKPQFSIELWSF